MLIKWAKAAERDFDKAVEYIAQDAPMAATDVARRIIEAAEKLASHPGMGRPGRIKGTRELIVPGLPFILPYKEKANAVFILRVLHTSRKWPNSLSES